MNAVVFINGAMSFGTAFVIADDACFHKRVHSHECGSYRLNLFFLFFFHILS